MHLIISDLYQVASWPHLIQVDTNTVQWKGIESKKAGAYWENFSSTDPTSPLIKHFQPCLPKDDGGYLERSNFVSGKNKHRFWDENYLYREPLNSYEISTNEFSFHLFSFVLLVFVAGSPITSTIAMVNTNRLYCRDISCPPFKDSGTTAMHKETIQGWAWKVNGYIQLFWKTFSFLKLVFV